MATSATFRDKRPIWPRMCLAFSVKSGNLFDGWLSASVCDTTRRDFYSPIPHLDQPTRDHLERRFWDGGIELALDAQMAFLEDELAPFFTEFEPPKGMTATADEFFLRNGTYESVDAETLYAIIRLYRPERIIELGAGRSTQVIALAGERNRSDGVRPT